MLALIAALALQAPGLTPKESVGLPDRVRVALSPSRIGKYLVVGESEQLDLRDGESLKPVKELPGRWTAFGFDEDDRRLLVIGDEVVLYETKTWKATSLGALPDAGFKVVRKEDPKSPLRPQQAWVTPDLDFYYLTADGGVSLATIQNRKVTTTKMGLKEHPEGPPTRILGLYGGGLLLTLSAGQAAITVKTDIYFLVASSRTFFLALHGNLAVGVGTPGEALYGTRTWANVGRRGGELEATEQTNLCAALDSGSGWVYVGDTRGLRAWNTADFVKDSRYGEFTGRVDRVAVSSPSLYTLEKMQLRRWTFPP
jgi:hypothetical protein